MFRCAIIHITYVRVQPEDEGARVHVLPVVHDVVDHSLHFIVAQLVAELNVQVGLGLAHESLLVQIAQSRVVVLEDPVGRLDLPQLVEKDSL